MRYHTWKHGHREGYRHSPTYQSWHAIISYTKRRPVNLDPDWRKFANFLRDMGERPEGTRLRRLDTEDGFNKFNCEWVEVGKRDVQKRPGRRG